jgi:hypothetical protein
MFNVTPEVEEKIGNVETVGTKVVLHHRHGQYTDQIIELQV